ncbi:peroxiredoxin (alkyl hydroperoxide reductase subunit C) [Saprolegnia diclina VS20]|uniref:thioredoxin-dependent peroxiredoxin n=1 Tax=Saprolegnia diclina (strain VS20) TaxID=1156394 RepID=T0S7C2_SAPDV|nr:peroxiredoxin (alkyl hydroperoxide reductase subunit C) [Saprolegnia diclina VS20]EQC38582.1 peroxiredoxin (alkyl hydroperoxide reductase subunit C) [Saprolegnia diclina VS20]|eukprot:XP_008608174.1 peroxiredoxin (alkyl hydroperoxide reductase subunit C) [Saprolegnia diclina VS20]
MMSLRTLLKMTLLLAALVAIHGLKEKTKSVGGLVPEIGLTEAQLAKLGYVKKNQHSSTSFQVTPRKHAPQFHDVKSVVNEKFTTVSLDDYKGKWLVLFFYPFDFTFVCPTEIVSFSDSIKSFRSINAEVLAISTDSHHTHLAWIKTPREKGGLGKMNIPILADISKRISSDYGVLVTDEDDEMFGAALRGLFIIDPKGVVRSIQINDDQVGRSVDETLRILKAFSYADSHPGEVCPANWTPGSKTIKADQEAKYAFFEATYGNEKEL